MSDKNSQPEEMHGFEVRRTFSRAMTWHDSLSDQFVEKLWRSPDELMTTGEPLQDKERCLVVRLSDGPDQVVVKRQNWGGPWKTFCKSLRTPQARQSFHDGLFLLAAGIRTPKPLALVEHNFGPFGRYSYLVSECIRGTSLYRLMRFESPPQDLIEHVLEQVVELCRQFDHLRVSHNDLKAENLMIDPAGRVWIIDLEKMRRHKHVEPVRARMLEDLKRLLHPRSWRGSRIAAERLREQLLADSSVAAALAQVNPSKHPLLATNSFDRGEENKLSVLVASTSDVQDLHACVESFRDIADQIVVADARPTAETREAADRLGCQLVERIDDAESVLDLRNRALAQTQHPWVLVVEGEERISPDLSKEIQCLLTDSPKADAYRIGRRRVYLGHISKFGVFRREAPVRLFRREKGQFVASRLRARIETTASSVGSTNSKIVYHLCWHVADLVRSMNRNTTRLAEIKFEQGQQPKLLLATFRACRRFVKNYFWRHAYLDGSVGLQISILSAFSVLVTEAKLWELRHAVLPQTSFADETAKKTKLFRDSNSDSENDVLAPHAPAVASLCVPDEEALGSRAAC